MFGFPRSLCSCGSFCCPAHMVFGSPSSGHGKDEGLPKRTKHRVLMSGNNHSFIQHESKGTSEEEIQDKVMKRPTIQQAIPYQYANNPKMMEHAIHYLTKREFRCIGGVCVFYITSVVYISSTNIIQKKQTFNLYHSIGNQLSVLPHSSSSPSSRSFPRLL